MGTKETVKDTELVHTFGTLRIKKLGWVYDNTINSMYPHTIEGFFFPNVVYGKWSGGTQVKLHSNEAKEFVKTATGSDYEVMNLSNDDPLLSMILLKFPKDGA